MRASPYRLIHPYHPAPSSPMQYHSRRRCRAPPTTTRKLSRTQAPSRQTFHHRQPTQQPISSYQSKARDSYRQPVTLIFGWSATDTFHWNALRISSNRSPYCRSVPQRAGILQTATIILSRHFYYSSNPRNRRRRSSIRVSSRSRDHQLRRQTSIDYSNPPFHALTAFTPVHHHIST